MFLEQVVLVMISMSVPLEALMMSVPQDFVFPDHLIQEEAVEMILTPSVQIQIPVLREFVFQMIHHLVQNVIMGMV